MMAFLVDALRFIVKFLSYVLGGVLILTVFFILVIAVGTIALTPLMIWIRKRQGRMSVAARVIEAEGWAGLIAAILVAILLIGLGVGSLNYEPLRTFWTTPPSALAVVVFIGASIAVLASVMYGWAWEDKLFERPKPYTETKMPDGTVRIKFHRDQTNGDSR